MSLYHDPDQISAIRPEFREAFKIIFQGNSYSYITQDELDLKQTADTEPWKPSELIREHVRNFDEITIELVTDKTNLVEVRDKLEQSRHVGLVLMGKSVSRYERPLLIVLTTESVYYAIEPNDVDRGILFLKNRLESKESKITFWTTDSLREAECLKYQYDIDLFGSRAKCCTGLNLHLLKLFNKLPHKALKSNQFYPPRPLAAAHSRSHKCDHFEQLIDLWLDVHHEHIFFEQQKMVHLKCRPLNLTATNLILKRCVLVRRLAECLNYYARVELHIMNRRALNTMLELKAGAYNAIRAELNRAKDNELVNVQYFSHLDYYEESEEAALAG